ncbi:MAG TPA: hypothetical protein PK916_09145 [Bacteroidota bacterium]|nr:hypothetical protein [Bacteroidota bacterium]
MENESDVMIQRLKELFQVDTDDNLALGLRLGRGNITNWRKRDAMSRQLVERRIPGVNWDWLTTGKGDPFMPTPEGRALKERVEMHRGDSGARDGNSVREDKAPFTVPVVSRMDEDSMHAEYQRLAEVYGLRERWEDLPDRTREAFKKEYVLMLGQLRRVQSEYEQRMLVAIVDDSRERSTR